MGIYKLVSDKVTDEIVTKLSPVCAVLAIKDSGEITVMSWHGSEKAAKSSARSHPMLKGWVRNGIAYHTEIVPVVQVG